MGEPTQKRSGYQNSALIFGALMLVYFACPFLYVWPVLAFYDKAGTPPAWVERAVSRFLSPIWYLVQHVPVYRDLLQKEAQWLGFND